MPQCNPIVQKVGDASVILLFRSVTRSTWDSGPQSSSSNLDGTTYGGIGVMEARQIVGLPVRVRTSYITQIKICGKYFPIIRLWWKISPLSVDLICYGGKNQHLAL